MSAQRRSRAFQQGQVKALQRIKQPLAPLLRISAPPPRNPVARVLSARATGAGRHIRDQGAQRRADRMALRRMVADAMNVGKESA